MQIKQKLKNYIKKEWFFILVFVIAIILLVPNLGNRYISLSDEVSSLVISKNIVETGQPIFAEENYATAKVFGNDWWVLNTPLTEYMIAGSFIIFGITNFAARFPSVIFAFLSLIIFWYVLKELPLKESARKIALLLIVLNPLFYLFARHARYYGLVFLLVMLSIYFFIKFLKNDNKKFKFNWGLIISLTILFYSMIQTFGELSFIFFCFVILFYRKHFFKLFKNYVIVGIFSLLWLIPWLFIWRKIGENSFSLLRIPINFAIVLYYFFIYFIPLILLILLPKLLRVIKMHKDNNIKKLMLFPLAYIILGIIFKSIFNHNIAPEFRKIVVLILFMSCILIAQLLTTIKNKKIIIVIIILLITSNILFIAPILPVHIVKNQEILYETTGFSQYTAQKFINNTANLKFYFFNYIYELTHNYVGPTKATSNFINEHTNTKDFIYVSWDPYPFEHYTNRKITRNLSLIENSDVDWVIFGDDPNENYWINISEIDPNENYYLYTTLNNNLKQWLGTPELAHHRFKTNTNGKIFIYKKKGLELFNNQKDSETIKEILNPKN